MPPEAGSGMLMLHAQTEVMVAAHFLIEGARADGWGRGAGQLRAEEKIGHRPYGRRLVVEGCLVEPERHHVVVDPIARALLLVEEAVAAAHHRPVVERLPGEADARPELRPVGLRDRQRKPCLAARLNRGLEERVR